jgi:hypothetical protein
MKILLLALSLSWHAVAQGPRVDFEKQKAEVLDRFQTLIRINTSSPPGRNEGG